MRHLAKPFSLLSALLLAAPAAAQIVGPLPHEPVRTPDPLASDSRLPGPGIGRDLRDLIERTEKARERRSISRREARGLKREARHIGFLADIYAQDGLSDSERRELEARSLYLRGMLNRPGAPQPPKKRRD